MKEESSISFWVVFFYIFCAFWSCFFPVGQCNWENCLTASSEFFSNLPRVRNIRKVVFCVTSWNKKTNFSNLYQIKVLMTSSPSIMRTFIFNICGKIIMEKYQRQWDERGLTFFGAAGDVFRSWLRTFEDIGEWVRTPQKIHDCPLRVRAKQTQRSPFCPISEMESFAPFFGSWLAAAALQWKSQNRRKCDGKGSNLQHLKDNWPAAALLGKSIVKCWMSQKFPPASSDEVFTTGFQDFKIVSKREAKANSKWEKVTFFLHHLQTASCLGHDLKKKVWEMETTLKGWRWGGLLLQFAAMLDTSIKSPTTAAKKEKTNNLAMQPQGVLDFLIRRIRRKLFKEKFCCW